VFETYAGSNDCSSSLGGISSQILHPGKKKEYMNPSLAIDGKGQPLTQGQRTDDRDPPAMKVLTVLGTRPEFIRLSRIIEKLDSLCRHVVVHTGQNYDANLDEIFFREMAIRAPDHHLAVRGTFAEQVGGILVKMEPILREERPDRFLVLGDTNSSLAAVCAKRMGIPVYHMEAGNRCYDDRVPEEVNRRIIDHSSDVLMPYTHRSKENLLREGIERQRIFVIGNPIYEVMNHYHPQIQACDILQRLELKPRNFFLVTLHRAENVDAPKRLANFLMGLELVAEQYQKPVIVSLHPRTAHHLASSTPAPQSRLIRLCKPFGFFDFAKLERHAFCVLTDSGTVQEECAIFGIPNVTLRDTTERAETVECGSNILSGSMPAAILQAVRVALTSDRGWKPPAEYVEAHVSDAVAKIVLGFLREV
jgi:UDP-N-acetylglucosamine 2-epimerase (non-hydrolysing)